MDFEKMKKDAGKRSLNQKKYDDAIDAHYNDGGCSLFKPLGAVFPSKDISVFSCVDYLDKSEVTDYNSVHRYRFKNSLGHKDGEAIYDTTEQYIQFCKMTEDGMMPGVQDEQLLIAMIDRQKELNARFPSDSSIKKLKGLKMALEACEDRVKDRINRGVMGKLKK